MDKYSKHHRCTGPKHLGLLIPTCAVLAICTLPGCDDEQVHSYQAPKAAPYTPPAPMTSANAPSAAAPKITWEQPDGWQLLTAGSSMAMASFDVPNGSDQTETSGAARVTVTPLTGQAGGILANINRWRRQVGLEPIEVIEDQPMTAIHVDAAPAGLIDLASPDGVSAGIERMLVVLVPRPQENQTWFFKMIGPNDTVTQHKQTFVEFVESVTFGESGGIEETEGTGGTGGTPDE